MKSLSKWSALFTLLFIMNSCLKDECTNALKYVELNPVMMKAEDFRTNTITTTSTQELKNPGKIYFYKNYLLVNERGKGIHFYNLEDLSNPRHEIFYNIPGNFDIAIKNDQLIVDNVIDLISIDIKDIQHPELKIRSKNYKNVSEAAGQQFVAYYEKTNRTRVIDCSETGPNETFTNWNGGWWFSLSSASFDASVFSFNEVNSGTGNVGVAGSTTKFMLAKDMLYTLNDYQLWTWNTSSLEAIQKIDMGWGIETLFAQNDLLFVGSTSGMSIFSLDNPLSPRKLSELSHATACDPVVVQGNTAYVTLRSGNACTGNENQLDVIDISNATNPKLLKTYPMKNPHGLAILNDKLFICEGSYGFKILDASDRDKIKEKVFAKDIKSTDVIALSENFVMVVGDEGFNILDVSNTGNIKVISKINVEK